MVRAVNLPIEDPIYEVCGVSSADILVRCFRISGRQFVGVQLPVALAQGGVGLQPLSSRTTWRLIDFGDGSRTEFVQAVYLCLLGRRPHEFEVAARMAQLDARGTRLGLILRLMLSGEGRRRTKLPVAGVALPLISSCIRIAERMARAPVVAPLQRTLRTRLSRRRS